jgi:hypothetical protein
MSDNTPNQQQYTANYSQHLAQFASNAAVANVVPSSKQNALDTDRPRGGGWTKGFPHNKKANAMFRTEIFHALNTQTETDRQHSAVDSFLDS